MRALGFIFLCVTVGKREAGSGKKHIQPNAYSALGQTQALKNHALLQGQSERITDTRAHKSVYFAQ